MKNLDSLLAGRLNLATLFAIPFALVHEDPPVTEEQDPPAGETAEAKAERERVARIAKPKVVLTTEQQAFVNSLLAEEKRKGREANEKIAVQLETERNKIGTSEAEKDRLAVQIEELRSTHLTEKELTTKEQKKADAKKEKELSDAKAESKRWQDLFNSTTIKRQIVDAAINPKHKAANPDHIVSLLSPNTRLVEEVDEEGKATGEYVAKTKVRTVKDGKPATLDMTVTEAVAFLAEQDEHATLFDSGVSGGLGGNPNRSRKGGGGDPNTPPTDPDAYRAWRKANPGAVGAPARSTK